MSRIGKLPIVIPAGVEIKQDKNVVSVKGPKGELSQYVDPSIDMKIENGEINQINLFLQRIILNNIKENN